MSNADGQLKQIVREIRTAMAALEAIMANKLVTTAEGPSGKFRLEALDSLIHELAYAALLLDQGRNDEALSAIDLLRARCDALDPIEGTRSREEILEAIEQDLRVWLHTEDATPSGMPWKKIGIERDCLEKFPELGLSRIRRVISSIRCETLGIEDVQ